jgi:cystathionine beta-lyase/cystathionine gamma-synthase
MTLLPLSELNMPLDVIAQDMIRRVGIEHIDDLKADLDQAFAAAK